MGITRLANVTGLDTIGIPVVMAVRPNSRALAVSQGKGWDLDAAKASAAMESIESYHAERPRLPLTLATHRELQARGFSVAEVGSIRLAGGGCFHSDMPLLWAEGDDWLHHERVWTPFQLVHTAYTSAMRFDLSSFAASSTGLAGGNHLLEAASHAICEVVERDAEFRFHELPARDREERRIDLGSVDHPRCRELLDRCERAGVAVAVWDMTGDAGLAAFRCHIAQRETSAIRRLPTSGGSGCHPVRHIAFQRALTEAVQSRLTAISGARDDMARRDYRTWLDAGNLARLRQVICGHGARPFAAVPSYESEFFEDDVNHELELVRKAGFDRVIVFDLTHEEIGIPVVRVVIPGMEWLDETAPGELQS